MAEQIKMVATFVYTDRFIDVSPYFLLILGYSFEEFQSLSFKDIVDDYENSKLVLEIDNFNKGGDIFYFDDKVILKEATNLKLIGRLSVEPSIDRSKFLCSFTVIKKSEETIYDKYFSEVCTQSRNGLPCLSSSNFVCNLALVQLRKLMQDNASAIIILDAETKTIVEANKTAAEFYEYSIEELRGLHKSAIDTLPVDLLMQEVELAITGKKHFFIGRIKTSRGLVKDVHESTTAFTVNNKVYLFIIVTDITKRKQLERIIEEKNRVLVEANVSLSKRVQDEIETRKRKEQIFIQQARLVAMGEMMGAVSHHWREPINLVGILVQDLEDRALFEDITSEYISEIVKKIMDNLQIMSASIDNFTNFLRPSRVKKAFDVYASIKNVVELVHSKFENNRITVSLTCDCTNYPDKNGCIIGMNEPCTIQRTCIDGYVSEFKQIIFNVLINSSEAIQYCRSINTKFNDDEGLIFIRLHVDRKTILVTIEDNGGGFPNDLINRIFEPYFSTKPNGSGISLYMGKLFIEKNMNGVMTAKNKADGCCVEIKIPLN